MNSRIPSGLLRPYLRQKNEDAIEVRVRHRTWVYIINWQERGPCKIGVADDPRDRLVELQVGNPFPLAVYGAFGMALRSEAIEVEQGALKRFKGRRMRGEWVNATPLQVQEMIRSTCSGLGLAPVQWEAPARTSLGRHKAQTRAQAAMDEYQRLNSF